MQKFNHTTNDTLFSNKFATRGKEFGLKIVWNGKIKRDLFKVLFNATRMVEVGTEKQENGTQKP